MNVIKTIFVIVMSDKRVIIKFLKNINKKKINTTNSKRQ